MASVPPAAGAARRRALALALLAGTAVATLTGCFKLDLQMQLQPDDTVDGSIVIAVARDQAAVVGGEDALRESLQGSESGLLSQAPGEGTFEQRDYEDADWIGTETVFSDVPIDQFGQGDTGDLSITREGDEFVVDGTMDLAGDPADQADNASAQAIMASAELQIAITFPGPVSESNGTVDGTTVTWQPKAGEVVDISARGSAVAGVDWALIAAVVALVALVVVGVVLIVVVRRRDAAARASGVAPESVPTESVADEQPS